MDTQTPNILNAPTERSELSHFKDSVPTQNDNFLPGATVIYGMLGKCTIVSFESKKLGDEDVNFYKLQVQKSSLSRSSRQDPAIWVPMNTARQRGLRFQMSAEEASAVLGIFSNREYYFNLSETWSTVQKKLEACICEEGASGLAKVSSFLFVLKKKQIVLSSEVARLHEAVNKLLLRELSEITGEPVKLLEERITKSVKQKLLPDV